MQLPSTTQVLRPYMNLEWIKEDSLSRGALRHQSYAAYCLGTWAPKIDPQDQGALDSFRRWADKYIVRTDFVEHRFEDLGHGYTGTLDWGGELTICKLAVGDWKPPSGKGPITRAQVASYLNLATKNKFPAKKGFILRIDPGGGIAKLEWVEAGAADLAGFLACLSAYRFVNQK